jgi:hypothetical protein
LPVGSDSDLISKSERKGGNHENNARQNHITFDNYEYCKKQSSIRFAGFAYVIEFQRRIWAVF